MNEAIEPFAGSLATLTDALAAFGFLNEASFSNLRAHVRTRCPSVVKATVSQPLMMSPVRGLAYSPTHYIQPLDKLQPSPLRIMASTIAFFSSSDTLLENR